jgi:hypothetical protein
MDILFTIMANAGWLGVFTAWVVECSRGGATKSSSVLDRLALRLPLVGMGLARLKPGNAWI